MMKISPVRSDKHFLRPRFGKSIFLSVVLVLLLLSMDVACFAIQPIDRAVRQKGSFSPASVRLVIKDFIMTGGDKKFSKLESSLPELIALGLIDNESITYVSHEELMLETARKNPSSSLQEKKYRDLIFDSAVLDSLRIDFILTGNFFESRGKIYIKASLERRARKEGFITVPLETASAREVYPAVKQVADELNAVILSLVGKPPAQFAVFCFRDLSSPISESNKWLERDIPRTIVSGLQGKKRIRVIPFSETEASCEKDYNVPANSDVTIRGTFSIEDERITIFPALHARQTEATVQLPSRKGHRSNYYVFMDEFVKDLNAVIDTIVAEDGKLNLEPIAYKADTPGQYIGKGNEYLERNNLYVASLMFGKALTIKEDYEEGHYGLGLVRYRQGNYEAAMEELNKALAIIDKRKTRNEKGDARLEARIYQVAGKVLLDLSDNSKRAIEYFNRAIDIFPDLADIHFNLGEAYYVSGRPEEGIAYLRKALEKDKKNPRIYSMLGSVYLSQKSYDEAIKAYEAALKIDPGNADILSESNKVFTEKGLQLIRQGKFEEALKNYSRALEIGNKTDDIYFYRGYVFQRLDKPTDALSAYTQSINIRPQSYAYINRGIIYHNQGNLNEALENYSKAIELDPKLVQAYHGRGGVYERQNRFAEALENFNKAIELDPKYVPGYHSRGVIYERKNKLAEALAEYSKAIDLDPKYVPGYHGRGVIYERQNKLAEALVEYSKAIDLDPRYVSGYIGRGGIYLRQNRLDEALADYGRTIELDPKYVPGYHGRGMVYERQNRFADALADYSKVIDLAPQYASVYLRRGVIYGKQNKPTEAIENYKKALELEPQNAILYLCLSEALIMSGNYNASLDNINKSSPLMMNQEVKAINLYFKGIAQKMLNMDTSVTESDLDQLLQKPLQRIELNWSFLEMETWALNANLQDHQRNYIKEKNETLKKYMQ